MITILLLLSVFAQLLIYIIIFDVIISWLAIFWVRIRPQFLADLIDPLYKFIREYLPTRFGPVDFTPIVFVIVLGLIQLMIFSHFPQIPAQLPNYLK